MIRYKVILGIAYFPHFRSNFESQLINTPLPALFYLIILFSSRSFHYFRETKNILAWESAKVNNLTLYIPNV